MIRWWRKLLEMSADRLSRKCFEELKRIAELDDSFIDNWALILQDILIELGENDLWILQNPSEIKKREKIIGDKLALLFKNSDLERIQRSSFNQLYKQIHLKDHNPIYFSIITNITKMKITVQIRLANERKTKLYLKKGKQIIISNEICTYCNMQKLENLEHLLIECPMYRTPRQKYLFIYLQNCTTFSDLLVNNDLNKINNFFYFITEVSLIQDLINQND